MIGIVLAAHGRLSEGFKSAAEVIFGVADSIQTVNLELGDDVQMLGQKISNAVTKADQGDGVVVLTDLTNASPYNQSLIAVNQMPEDLRDRVYVLSGMNLPMVLETLNHQIIGTSIHNIEAEVQYRGKEGVNSWHYEKLKDLGEDEDF